MAYRFFDPLSALQDLQRALDSTRRSDWFGGSTTGTGTFPAVNVFSKGQDCVIVAELPGVKKSDIHVNVKGKQIRISGTKDISYDDSVSIHRRERSSGNFDRTLTVPIEVDDEKVQAEYHDGILAVYLPRAEADKPRSVPIS
jgi:HSP20 family protein